MTYRVLAAEDSPTQAAVLQSHLESAGFDVSMARDGAEALSLLRRRTFDIVVSDVVMPDVDGYELCRQAKQLAPQLPVMLLTSLDDPMDVVNALRSGADGFLRKPYRADDLLQRVRAMLRPGDAPAGDVDEHGIELSLSGHRFVVNAGRQQVLDLLVSTFESLVSVNRELRSSEAHLAMANEKVATRLAEAELERQRLRSVLGALPHAMAVVDSEGTIVHVNESMASLLDRPVEELVGSRSWEVVDLVDHSGNLIERERRAIQRCLATGEGATLGTAFDLFVRRANGSEVPAITRTAPICDRSGAVVGAVAVVEDIGALMAHDPVTGLPGHGILVDRLDGALEAAGDDGARTGLLVVKVDRFDRIREALPTADSDRVVAGVAERLKQALESEKIHQRTKAPSAAYLGNGELAVILPAIVAEADAILVAEWLVGNLSQPVAVGDVEVGLTVSVAVGVADRAVESSALVTAVAAAARRASSEGGARVTGSNPVLHAEVVDRLQRESDLRTAISEHQLVVHYQPQIDLETGRAVAVEALVRWQHPRLGLLGAGEIIPLAIESDLIAPLGWSVLEQACEQAAAWRRGALPFADALVLSVNLAAEQLLDADVDLRVRDILAGAGLAGSALVLEITEGSVMTEPAVSGQRLAAIRGLGVQIAIDDFGTGYSSLLQLRELPVDVLKIDRTFVSGLTHEPADVAIVAGTVGLARALGLEIVAEGVETPAQLTGLRRLGCDLGQGYHWAKPMPAAEMALWWDRHAADTRT